MDQLEEDRLLASGRTKIPGMKTRMELAWHKEREEQTRLLQETSTLARDLRQTLFEVKLINHFFKICFLNELVFLTFFTFVSWHCGCIIGRKRER